VITDGAGYWVDPPEALLPLMDEAGVVKAIVGNCPTTTGSRSSASCGPK
jgi:hypothetical protein